TQSPPSYGSGRFEIPQRRQHGSRIYRKDPFATSRMVSLLARCATGPWRRSGLPDPTRDTRHFAVLAGGFRLVSISSRVNRYRRGVTLERSIHSLSVWNPAPTYPRPSSAGVPTDIATADSEAPPFPDRLTVLPSSA